MVGKGLNSDHFRQASLYHQVPASSSSSVQMVSLGVCASLKMELICSLREHFVYVLSLRTINTYCLLVYKQRYSIWDQLTWSSCLWLVMVQLSVIPYYWCLCVYLAPGRYLILKGLWMVVFIQPSVSLQVCVLMVGTYKDMFVYLWLLGKRLFSCTHRKNNGMSTIVRIIMYMWSTFVHMSLHVYSM